MDLLQLAQRIHKRVQSKSFSKTDFALNLLLKNRMNGLSQHTLLKD